jgi:superfamily II DNA or RNA helicase
MDNVGTWKEGRVIKADIISIPQAGQTVIVRNRPALVRSVDERTHPSMAATHEVQVEYIDGWPHPHSDYLIWELERGARVVASLAIPRIDEPDHLPDDPALLHAFLRANQWSAVNRLAAQRDQDEQELRLISPWQSAVQVEDYQLYPVLKALLMPRISLLLADDVGLGKTIEAGLILSELFVRRRIRRVLIICPASLQLQWRDEMRAKFNLDFTIVDRDETFRLQRDLGVDSNPWMSYPRIITSMDYLRQGDVLGSFVAATNSLSGKFEAILPWQMLIVDEVHNLTPSHFGDDSDRCSMLRRITPFFEHRLFLSATPHNGYTVSFTGLLELLDPVRFQQKARLDEHDHQQVSLTMVRRLKQELTQEGEQDRFAPRYVEALPIPVQGLEKQLFDALRAYRESLRTVLGQVNKRERHLSEFLIKLLTKRLLSSSYAFAWTWWRHVEGENLHEDAIEAVEVTEHAIGRAERPINDDQERSLREEDAIQQTGAWLKRYAEPLQVERQAVSSCLIQMGWSADALQQPLNSVPLPADAKWDRVWQWINDHLKQGNRLRDDERLIIFTEYKHSLDYVMERLRRAGLASPQVESLYGGATSEQRERIKDAFNDPRDPLRILVGTDTVSEGISLQTTCRYVMHQEIPWNPMRLEQRNGRVDRHGQERDVFVFHFTSDDEADLLFMARVVEKVNQARTDLGSVGQVIDSAIVQHFTEGSLSLDEFDQCVRTAQRDPQEQADLQTHDRGGLAFNALAMQRLAATEMALGLTPEHAAALLQQAVAHEQGELIETEDGKAYRFRVVPPTWKKLVKETIERQNDALTALPKLVFDPLYFEERHNGRRIFKPRTDAELIRLGHPLMQRAIGVLRRRMWDGQGMTRWTEEGCALPSQIQELLLLHMFLEVTNAFREVAHQEVMVVPFEIRGNRLYHLDSGLWAQVNPLPRFPLTSQELGKHVPLVRERWPEHQRQIRDLLVQQRNDYRQEFAARMQQRYREEVRATKAIFDERLRELEQQQKPNHLKAMHREIEEQRKKLLQPVLFSELLLEQQQQLRLLDEAEWELHAIDYLDQMKQMVSAEQQRMLEYVLPKRYALATVDVQPLAIEYLIRSTGNTGRSD